MQAPTDLGPRHRETWAVYHRLNVLTDEQDATLRSALAAFDASDRAWRAHRAELEKLPTSEARDAEFARGLRAPVAPPWLKALRVAREHGEEGLRLLGMFKAGLQ